jgi:hypothetical protein
VQKQIEASVASLKYMPITGLDKAELAIVKAAPVKQIMITRGLHSSYNDPEHYNVRVVGVFKELHVYGLGTPKMYATAF